MKKHLLVKYVKASIPEYIYNTHCDDYLFFLESRLTRKKPRPEFNHDTNLTFSVSSVSAQIYEMKHKLQAYGAPSVLQSYTAPVTFSPGFLLRLNDNY